jgi:hypothetical protein
MKRQKHRRIRSAKRSIKGPSIVPKPKKAQGSDLTPSSTAASHTQVRANDLQDRLGAHLLEGRAPQASLSNRLKLGTIHCRPSIREPARSWNARVGVGTCRIFFRPRQRNNHIFCFFLTRHCASAFGLMEAQGKSGGSSNQFTDLLLTRGCRKKSRIEARARPETHDGGSTSFRFAHCGTRRTTFLHEAGIPSAVAHALIGHDSEAMQELCINVGPVRGFLERAANALPEITASTKENN